MSSNLLIALIGIMCTLFFGTFLVLALVIANTLRPREEQKPTPPPREHTEEDERIRRAAQRFQKETMNMLTYNGDPQEEIRIE